MPSAPASKQPAPVLSLTVLDAAGLDGGTVQEDTNMLTVVRDGGVNRTHPDVVSVPTQRIPVSCFDDLCSVAVDEAAVGDGVFRAPWVDSRRANGHSATVFAVESLLARKLGLADALEREQLVFRAGLRARVDGVAVYDDFAEPDREEPVAMLNAVAVVERGASLLVGPTASYSSVVWSPVSAFLAGVTARNPGVIHPSLDPVQLCVHGVCLDAAALSLRSLLGRSVEHGDVDGLGGADLLQRPGRRAKDDAVPAGGTDGAA